VCKDSKTDVDRFQLFMSQFRFAFQTVNMFKLLCFLLSFSHFLESAHSVADRLGCRDESGNLLDWFYLYKIPSHLENDGSSNSGMNYLFITPSSSDQWTLSQRLMNDSSSMPGLTLSPVYEKKDENLVMMYNDEPPTGQTDGTRGHTKGVVVANDISGFWLVHSVPKYPPAPEEGYNYPHSGLPYGQSFLCMSFTGDQMGKIGNQLIYNEPHFYSSHVPDYLTT
jgi:deoxyribonuclease II